MIVKTPRWAVWLLLCVVVSTATSHATSQQSNSPSTSWAAGQDSHATKPKYDYQYLVHNDEAGQLFGAKESRDGAITSGSYFVDLPDGRRQTVNYYVTAESGYVADITYEKIGEGFQSTSTSDTQHGTPDRSNNLEKSSNQYAGTRSQGTSSASSPVRLANVARFEDGFPIPNFEHLNRKEHSNKRKNTHKNLGNTLLSIDANVLQKDNKVQQNSRNQAPRTISFPPVQQAVDIQAPSSRRPLTQNNNNAPQSFSSGNLRLEKQVSAQSKSVGIPLPPPPRNPPVQQPLLRNLPQPNSFSVQQQREVGRPLSLNDIRRPNRITTNIRPVNQPSSSFGIPLPNTDPVVSRQNNPSRITDRLNQSSIPVNQPSSSFGRPLPSTGPLGSRQNNPSRITSRPQQSSIPSRQPQFFTQPLSEEDDADDDELRFVPRPSFVRNRGQALPSISARQPFSQRSPNNLRQSIGVPLPSKTSGQPQQNIDVSSLSRNEQASASFGIPLPSRNQANFVQETSVRNRTPVPSRNRDSVGVPLPTGKSINVSAAKLEIKQTIPQHFGGQPAIKNQEFRTKPSSQGWKPTITSNARPRASNIIKSGLKSTAGISEQSKYDYDSFIRSRTPDNFGRQAFSHGISDNQSQHFRSNKNLNNRNQENFGPPRHSSIIQNVSKRPTLRHNSRPVNTKSQRVSLGQRLNSGRALKVNRAEPVFVMRSQGHANIGIPLPTFQSSTKKVSSGFSSSFKSDNLKSSIQRLPPVAKFRLQPGVTNLSLVPDANRHARTQHSGTAGNFRTPSRSVAAADRHARTQHSGTAGNFRTLNRGVAAAESLSSSYRLPDILMPPPAYGRDSSESSESQSRFRSGGAGRHSGSNRRLDQSVFSVFESSNDSEIAANNLALGPTY